MSSKLAEEYWKEEYSEEDWWVEQGYANPDDVPSPDWHLAILKEREALYASEDKTKWTTWEEFEKELMQEILEEMKRRKK